MGGLLGKGDQGYVGPPLKLLGGLSPPPFLAGGWTYLKVFWQTMLQDTVQGKRRKGRQKKRWEDYGVDRDGLC